MSDIYIYYLWMKIILVIYFFLLLTYLIKYIVDCYFRDWIQHN